MISEAIIFDLDGVLVDSWAVAQRALALALSDVGYTGMVPFAGFRALLGKPLATILRELRLPLEAEAAFNRHALNLVEEVRPFPDVAGMLARLRGADIAIGVVTGKARHRALATLEHTGLWPFIGALITPEDAPGKPDPRALEQCIHALQSKGTLCFVGDTEVDSATARAAAIPAALAAWGASHCLPANQWDLVFHEPDDVVRFILAGQRQRTDPISPACSRPFAGRPVDDQQLSASTGPGTP